MQPHVSSQTEIRIFDSATHPTLDGYWSSGRRGQTFEELAASIRKFPHYRVLAHGLPNIGKYSHNEYKERCDEFGFEAIAALTTTAPSGISSQIQAIAKLGYRGLKVHPRLLRSNRNLGYLHEVFRACTEFNLVCLLCTYEAQVPGDLPVKDPYYEICDALNSSPTTRLILMHGGVSRLLQYAGLARHASSILLDISFTMMDRLTQSMEDTINSLANELDERICLGSDSPDFSIFDFVMRARELLEGIPTQKATNIASGNLNRFFPK
jgi:hypothetical protein